MDIQHTIHGLFEQQVKRTPADIAIICEDQTITYQCLNERSNQLAHYLLELGVQPQNHVAICMERSIDLLCVIFAILKVGGVYVPLDPLHPEARLLFTLTDNNDPFVIIKSDMKERFTHYQGQLIMLDEVQQQIIKLPTHNLNLVLSPQQLAYVIYTSGSTGKPKGALIEHRSVVNYCEWFVSYSACQSFYRIDFSSNYIFDMAVTTSIVPLMIGLTIVICNDETKKEVRNYLRYLENNKINVIKATPSYFKVLLHEIKNNPPTLPDLKTIILGGENLPTTDCVTWLATYPEQILINEYGPTEATVAISHYKIAPQHLHTLGTSVPIGQPGPNMECYIVDESDRLVAEGEVGELLIGGVCLARGYLNQTELTQKSFIKNTHHEGTNSRLYKTGDLCRRLPDGMIEYMGRIDNQVKIRGFRIEPGEIERCLMNHLAIKDVVVLAQKDELHEKLIAYYILDDINTAPNVSQLQQYLNIYLPEYMIPAAFVRINAFPLTANNKLDRQALPIPRFTTNQHYLAPSTDLEKTLATIWAEELGLKLIGIEDNFFELGGHSLSAARIISKINSTLGKEIALREFYEAATIKKLLTGIDYENNNSEKSASLPAVIHEEQALLPLTDFQLLLWLSNTFEPKAKKINIFARKRVKGRLDKEALTFAFNAVLKKHEILFYRILKLRPAQRLQKELSVVVAEKNLISCSEQESEVALRTSINELEYYADWHKDAPLLVARLFHLQGEEAEVQICMPHMISDNVSPHIIFSDLSRFYLRFNEHSTIDMVNTDKRYRDYQENEQLYSQDQASRDVNFWEKYLNDAHLFPFPTEYIVKDMSSAGLSYSTYTEIPEQTLKKLQQFCAENCVSINDGLCAALGLALVNCCSGFTDETKNIFMNIVKSTRGNQLYDDTVGCFLKLEPIKVGLRKHSNLIDLAKQIHQSTIETAPFQQCSSLTKLACIHTLRQRKQIVKKYLISTLAYLYTKILPTPNLDRKTIKLCHRLSTTKKTNFFAININVHQSFISASKNSHNDELFGLKSKKIKKHHSDILEIDRFLDVCLLRDESDLTPYIVISANLIPSFRSRLAQEMIQIIDAETLINSANIQSNFDDIQDSKMDPIYKRPHLGNLSDHR